MPLRRQLEESLQIDNYTIRCKNIVEYRSFDRVTFATFFSSILLIETEQVACNLCPPL
jgi:hypothetical protein